MQLELRQIHSGDWLSKDGGYHYIRLVNKVKHQIDFDLRNLLFNGLNSMNATLHKTAFVSLTNIKEES